MAAAKKKKRGSGAGWSWRLAGIALCAFFALGVITGLSQSGRIFALRVESLIEILSYHRHSEASPSGFAPERRAAAIVAAPSHSGEGALVLVERTDGFYTLDAQGDLRGPVSPTAQSDVPVLSGDTVRNADPARLLDYAAMLVRAEAGLSEMASEMRIARDGDATLYLDHPQIAIVLGPDDSANEVEHAARILNLWRGHRELIETVDVTTPGQAVVRLKAAAIASLWARDRSRKAAAFAQPRSRMRSSPEVTASR